MSRLCFLTRCGSVQDLDYLDVGVDGDGSMGKSKERIFILYRVWLACLAQFGGGGTTG